MAAYFNSKGIKSLSMYSKSDVSRTDSIEKLRNREIEVLFSVDYLMKG